MTNNADCEQIGKKLNYQYEHLLCFKQTWRSETPTASIGNNLCEGQQLHFFRYLLDKRYLKIKELSFLVRSVCVTNFPTCQQHRTGTVGNELGNQGYFTVLGNSAWYPGAADILTCAAGIPHHCSSSILLAIYLLVWLLCNIVLVILYIESFLIGANGTTWQILFDDFAGLKMG